MSKLRYVITWKAIFINAVSAGAVSLIGFSVLKILNAPSTWYIFGGAIIMPMICMGVGHFLLSVAGLEDGKWIK